MTLNDLEKLLSEKTGRKVEFGPLQHDATTLSFKKSLYADGRKIEFKWRPVDDEEFEETEIDMETALIETVCWVINETFEKETT